MNQRLERTTEAVKTELRIALKHDGRFDSEWAWLDYVSRVRDIIVAAYIGDDEAYIRVDLCIECEQATDDDGLCYDRLPHKFFMPLNRGET